HAPAALAEDRATQPGRVSDQRLSMELLWHLRRRGRRQPRHDVHLHDRLPRGHLVGIQDGISLEGVKSQFSRRGRYLQRFQQRLMNSEENIQRGFRRLSRLLRPPNARLHTAGPELSPAPVCRGKHTEVSALEKTGGGRIRKDPKLWEWFPRGTSQGTGASLRSASILWSCAMDGAEPTLT